MTSLSVDEAVMKSVRMMMPYLFMRTPPVSGQDRPEPAPDNFHW